MDSRGSVTRKEFQAASKAFRLSNGKDERNGCLLRWQRLQLEQIGVGGSRRYEFCSGHREKLLPSQHPISHALGLVFGCLPS